jgi:hypothetical protein
MHTLFFDLHTAHLCPLTGSGVLVLPDPRGDVFLGSESLHSAALRDVLAALDRSWGGWDLTEDEYGDMVREGTTLDGRPVVGLYGREPIMDDPSLDACAQSFADLRTAARLVRS